MEEKECGDCKVIKHLNEYRKYTDRENSYAKTCKQCLNERDKKEKS